MTQRNDISLPDAVIGEFVRAHPRISGRDVKNLLKLATFRLEVRRHCSRCRAMPRVLQARERPIYVRVEWGAQERRAGDEEPGSL